MKYKGKVYAKINGKYIECTQTVEELETEIQRLKDNLAFQVEANDKLLLSLKEQKRIYYECFNELNNIRR